MGWEMYFYVLAFILLSPVTESQVALDNSDRTGGEKQHPHPLTLQGSAETSVKNPAPRLLVARYALKAGTGLCSLFYGNLGSRSSHRRADRARPRSVLCLCHFSACTRAAVEAEQQSGTLLDFQ